MSGFVYVQARLQARYGQRLDAGAWSRLESLADFSLFLKHSRETTMGSWVSAIDDASDVHTLESRLQQYYLDLITEVANWPPKSWRPAVLWTQNLFELPSAATGQSQAIDPQEPLLAWLDEWRRLWPGKGGWHKQLEEVIKLVHQHVVEFADLESQEQAIAARAGLQSGLELRFRRFAASPAGLFVFLLLVALDYERLLGGLVSRLFFDNSTVGQE